MRTRPIHAMPPESADLRGALTTAEVAAILKVKPSTVRDWRAAGRRGQPPYVEVMPKLVRYPLKQFNEWMAKLTLKGRD